MTPIFFLLLAGAYLLGSVPFGILVGRVFFGVDPRTVGSGNIGTANSMRAFGRSGAAAVLIGDVLKGALPTFVATHVLGDSWAIACVALAAIVGHNWSVFLHFQGGKGVATTLGVIIALSFPAATAFGAVWLATAALTRYSSVASMLASAAVPIALVLLKAPMPYVYCGIAALALVVWRHEANIRRLANGAELKIGSKKSSQGES